MPALIESPQKAGHSTWLEIRLDRLRANLAAIRQYALPDCRVMAVVKSNAYGHGLLEIARALAGEAACLGISSVSEALQLKEYGIETPIFLFGRPLAREIPAVLTDGITLSVSSLEEAEEISGSSLALGRKTPVHVKVDTGMGRLGIPAGEALRKIEAMAALGGILLDGIYTHFPAAEREDGFTARQVQDFLKLIEALEARGIRFRFRHAANSTASLKIRNPWLNLIRPGLMLYGIYPDPSIRNLASIHPILALKSRILLVKRIKAGDSVGYGRDFIAKRPTTVATLAIGYSHGYPFRASNRAMVLFRGKRYPLAGRVSMDYLAVDLGETTAEAGDEVTLLGEDGTGAIGAEELAEWAGTIPYEIVTQLVPNLPRFYRP